MTQSLEELGKLERYTKVAIREGYLLGILVTSQAQASLPSEGWSFGAGKTTFALKWAKDMCYGGDFEKVKENLIGFAEQLEPFFGIFVQFSCILNMRNVYPCNEETCSR